MTRLLRPLAVAAVGGALAATAFAQVPPPGDQLVGRFVRREIQRAPSSVPGRDIVQVATELPVGVESGWHIHPGEEVGYIVVGTVEMKVDGRETVVLRAGQGFLIPPRTPHNARDLGPEDGRMLSTYFVETGQPLATIVEAPASASR